jgi:hypothetical protein
MSNTVSIATRTNAQPVKRQDLLLILQAIQADLAALRTAVNAHSHAANDAAANAGTAPALRTQP